MTHAERVLSAIRQSGFVHFDDLIHVFVGGSELHGAKIKNTDDLDIYGVYLEPPELVLGLEKNEFFVWSTAGMTVEMGRTTLISACIRSGSGRG